MLSAPEALRGDLEIAITTDAAKRNEVQKYLIGKLGSLVAVTDKEVETALSEEQRKAIAAHTAKIAELTKSKPSAGASRLVALEDLCWALLNTNEFLFNH